MRAWKCRVPSHSQAHCGQVQLDILGGHNPEGEGHHQQVGGIRVPELLPCRFTLLGESIRSQRENRPVDEKIKATSMENLGKVFDVYEAQLSKHKYLAGDTYTLADVFHTPLLLKVNTLDLFAGAFNNRPHVKTWVDNITSNPAFLKTRKLVWYNATPF